MTWTPYQIEIILYHHCCQGPFPRHEAPAYRGEVEYLIKIGVLKFEVAKETAYYTTTELGQALVSMWTETPLPVVAYVDPRLKGAA